MTTIRKYPYYEFNKDIGSIVSQIDESGEKFDYIVGLVRGGAIPGIYLSHRLNIPIQMVHWSTRDNGILENEHNFCIPEDLSGGSKILLVEDIIDTGLSITTLLDNWFGIEKDWHLTENIKIATLFYNENNQYKIKADYHGQKYDPSKWILFPWEV